MMTMLWRGGSPAVHQITEGLAALDAEVFEAVAKSPTPMLDTTMPAHPRRRSRKLWLAIAAAMAMSTTGRLAAARAAAWSPWR